MSYTIIQTKKEIQDLLEEEIKNIQGPVCIQAGHFALVSDKNSEVIPAIFEDIVDPETSEKVKTHPYMGHVPLTTFQLGASLAKFGRDLKKDIRLLMIVNDWQWVKQSEGATAQERRNQYYANAKIPESYQKELDKVGLRDDVFMPFKDREGKLVSNLFFSEMILRDQFDRYFAISCPIGNSCAQEYVPLLSKLESEKIKLLISFVPKTCQVAVNDGTAKFKEAYGGDLRVINIFVNGVFEKDFWKGVGVSIV